jgi:hypothetical protein
LGKTAGKAMRAVAFEKILSRKTLGLIPLKRPSLGVIAIRRPLNCSGVSRDARNSYQKR